MFLTSTRSTVFLVLISSVGLISWSCDSQKTSSLAPTSVAAPGASQTSATTPRASTTSVRGLDDPFEVTPMPEADPEPGQEPSPVPPGDVPGQEPPPTGVPTPA